MKHIPISNSVSVDLYDDEWTDAIVKAVRRGIDESLQTIYMPALMKNTELDDHTLAELARLGHPYARRYDPSRLGPQIIHGGEDRLVHNQSGALQKSFRQIRAVDGDTSVHGHIVSQGPAEEYVNYLLKGTTRMRPRRFNEKTLDDVQERIFVPLVKELRSLGVSVGRGGSELVAKPLGTVEE